MGAMGENAEAGGVEFRALVLVAGFCTVGGGGRGRERLGESWGGS